MIILSSLLTKIEYILINKSIIPISEIINKWSIFALSYLDESKIFANLLKPILFPLNFQVAGFYALLPLLAIGWAESSQSWVYLNLIQFRFALWELCSKNSSESTESPAFNTNSFSFFLSKRNKLKFQLSESNVFSREIQNNFKLKIFHVYGLSIHSINDTQDLKRRIIRRSFHKNK